MPNIILKDRDGNDVTYPDVNAIEVKTDDGLTQIFNCGDTSGETESGGDGESDVKAFVKIVTLNQTTSNYSANVIVATAAELEAAGIVLDRAMSEYTDGSDIAYISITKHNPTENIVANRILHSYVTNLVQNFFAGTKKKKNHGATYYYSSVMRDIGSSGMTTPNLYPVTYGSSTAGVEVSSTGDIQIKSRSSSYLFVGTYVLTVLYKKGSQTN